jgi:hypothetical protein
MYCSSNTGSSIAGPIAAAPYFPRLAPPLPPVPTAANVGPNRTALLLGDRPDICNTGVMSRVSSDGSQLENNNNHCLLNNHASSSNSRVSFHDLRMEVRVVSLACLSEEMRSDIWYSQADIESMRSEARDLCRFVRVNPQAYPPEHTRGLELRISLERQCRKQLTVQGVVEAQRRCADPCMLASLAQRCSMVPRELALAQAQQDFCFVYATNNEDNVINSTQQRATATAAPAACPMQFPADNIQGTCAFHPGHSPCDVDMDIKMPAVANSNYNIMIPAQIQNQNNSQGLGVCNNMNDNNLTMASFLSFCGQDAPYPHMDHQQQHAHNQDFFPNIEQQQHQQFPADLSFEPLPLGSDIYAATLPVDETMVLLDAVGDANSKRSPVEMWDNDPQARMVRPRLGGYPAV